MRLIWTNSQQWKDLCVWRQHHPAILEYITWLKGGKKRNSPPPPPPNKYSNTNTLYEFSNQHTLNTLHPLLSWHLGTWGCPYLRNASYSGDICSFLQLHVEPTLFNEFQAFFFKLKHSPLSLVTFSRLPWNSLELEITRLGCCSN